MRCERAVIFSSKFFNILILFKKIKINRKLKKCRPYDPDKMLTNFKGREYAQ